MLKSFTVWFGTEKPTEASALNVYTSQVDQIKNLLTELLGLVRQGHIDSRHSSDILKLIKRENLFGDYSYQLANQFIASGAL